MFRPAVLSMAYLQYQNSQVMKPYKIEIYVYAESEEKALEVQSAAKNFVRQQYQKGTLVTADKILNALTRFGNSIIVNQFLK